MRIAISSDHAGFDLKKCLLAFIKEMGHEVIDLGTFDKTQVDSPDYGEKGGRALQSGQAERAVMICGSGVGVCIAANKLKGVYASICHDPYTAHQGVEHDNMNALCLGARVIGEEVAKEIVKIFLSANFQPEERFIRRVGKIHSLESWNEFEE